MADHLQHTAQASFIPGHSDRGVLFGKNGHLFLEHGGHRISDYATGLLTITQLSTDIFWRNIESRARYADNLGARYLHVIFPDKQSTLPEYFPLAVTSCLGDTYLDCNRAALSPMLNSVVYLKSFLRSLPADPYIHTDTHLSDQASILVTGEIITLLTYPDATALVSDLLTAVTIEQEYAGDLGSRFTPPITTPAMFFRDPSSPLSHFSNRLNSNDGIIDIYFNRRPRTAHRLLCFGDSYGRALSRFLAYYFRDSIFLRTRFFHDEMIDLFKPDVVITQNAERYLDHCELDDDRPVFLLYPYLSQSPSYSPPADFIQALSAALSFPRDPYQRFRDALHASNT